MAALLGRLPHAEYQRLAPALERVHLAAKELLYVPGKPITHVYFPIDCVISLLTVFRNGKAVETGLVGREGVAGLPLFLGVTSGPQRAICQIAGEAWRLPAAAFLAAADGEGRLPNLLRRYTYALLLQTSQGMACGRAHAVAERCAYWLLLCHDRTGTDRLPLSHAFLAQMLGVRRATVTVVLAGLQARGLLAYARGRIDVLDRVGLEGAACECYGLLAGEFARLMTPPPMPAAA
jgi:CRP-like cAMP-binding protein